MQTFKEILATIAIGNKIKNSNGNFYNILLIEGAIILALRILLFIEISFFTKNNLQPEVLTKQPTLTVKIISAILIVTFTYFVIDRGYINSFRKRKTSSFSFLKFIIFLLFLFFSSFYIASTHLSPFLQGVDPTKIKQPFSSLLILGFFIYMLLELFPIVAEYFLEKQRVKEEPNRFEKKPIAKSLKSEASKKHFGKNENFEQSKKEIIKLIGDGEVLNALDQAIEIYSNRKEVATYKELILHKSSFKDLVKQQRSKQISFEAFQIARNEIVYSVLEILND